MKMNLPNKLTILRVLLIPFFVFFMLTDWWGYTGRLIALALFCVASFTDYLDGHIARKRGLVTNFGKFMDPLADKLLVCSALICFVELGELPAWIVISGHRRQHVGEIQDGLPDDHDHPGHSGHRGALAFDGDLYLSGAGADGDFPGRLCGKE